MVAVLAVVLAFVPLVLAPAQLSVAVRVLIFAILALGWNVMSGFGGMFSFGHAAYFGVGAYAYEGPARWTMDMVLAKTDLHIASRYAELVGDQALRERIFAPLGMRDTWVGTYEIFPVDREARGYTFEVADASLELLMRRADGWSQPFFEVESYRVHVEEHVLDQLQLDIEIARPSLEEAFVAANPGLTRAGVAVTCGRKAPAATLRATSWVTARYTRLKTATPSRRGQVASRARIRARTPSTPPSVRRPVPLSSRTGWARSAIRSDWAMGAASQPWCGSRARRARAYPERGNPSGSLCVSSPSSYVDVPESSSGSWDLRWAGANARSTW